jgi:hypothetical protein
VLRRSEAAEDSGPDSADKRTPSMLSAPDRHNFVVYQNLRGVTSLIGLRGDDAEKLPSPRFGCAGRLEEDQMDQNAGGCIVPASRSRGASDCRRWIRYVSPMLFVLAEARHGRARGPPGMVLGYLISSTPCQR